jgi:hypothetical protein
MPIQRDIVPDFQNAEVCNFLKNYASTSYSEETAVQAKWQAQGYVAVVGAKKMIPESERQMNLRTFSSHQCRIRTQAGRLLRTMTISDPVDHNLKMRIFALLFVKKELRAELVAAIKDAFSRTNPGPDVGTAETALIKAGASVDDYQVVLILELQRLRGPEELQINLKTFLQQTKSYTDRNGKLLYRIEVDEAAINECDLPPKSFDDKDIIKTHDANHPENDILNFENGQHHPCDGLEITPHRIGTAFQYYEWKVQWEVRPITIGPCQIMMTKIPIIYSRIRKEALWCYAMTEPQLKRNIEKAIIDCLISAAEETAVLAIVTGGLGLEAAAAAFCSACQDCLESKVSDAVVCLFTSLKLLAEIGDWQEKVF